MNLLDENIPKDQRLLLESWGIHVRKIGVNVLQRGTDDRGIIPFLQQHRCTFFTRDEELWNNGQPVTGKPCGSTRTCSEE